MDIETKKDLVYNEYMQFDVDKQYIYQSSILYLLVCLFLLTKNLKKNIKKSEIEYLFSLFEKYNHEYVEYEIFSEDKLYIINSFHNLFSYREKFLAHDFDFHNFFYTAKEIEKLSFFNYGITEDKNVTKKYIKAIEISKMLNYYFKHDIKNLFKCDNLYSDINAFIPKKHDYDKCGNRDIFITYSDLVNLAKELKNDIIRNEA